MDAIHADQLREHGGLPGVRDENGLEAALARPIQQWHYGSVRQTHALAAAYGFGLVTSHPYRDGNKRIGFLVAVTFMELNGHTFDATDAEVVAEFVSLASGHVTEEELADWMKRHSRKHRR